MGATHRNRFYKYVPEEFVSIDHSKISKNLSCLFKIKEQHVVTVRDDYLRRAYGGIKHPYTVAQTTDERRD